MTLFKYTVLCDLVVTLLWDHALLLLLCSHCKQQAFNYVDKSKYNEDKGDDFDFNSFRSRVNIPFSWPIILKIQILWSQIRVLESEKKMEPRNITVSLNLSIGRTEKGESHPVQFQDQITDFVIHQTWAQIPVQLLTSCMTFCKRPS